MLVAACGRGAPTTPALDTAAESYVRLALALGERDADSLDTYHGPPQWQADARARHASLAAIRSDATALAAQLDAAPPRTDDERTRRDFLTRQLRAIAVRIDVLRGARLPFADEARALFGLTDLTPPLEEAPDAIRAELGRLLPGGGALSARYAAFDRRFLVSADRLPAVFARAIDGCRAATAAHVALPAGERVDVEYVRDLPWSAFTRYAGASRSRIRVNASLPLTIDRVLDLACHEAYPGHHTIDTLLDARYGSRRVELAVRPLYSPQSLLHEASASLGGDLAFPGDTRTAFERDVLFPLAGHDPAEAARYVRVGRLVDRLYPVALRLAQQYVDGALDFPRASAALDRDALMPSADATLTFLNRFRSYAATYTAGRARMAERVGGSWEAYVASVTAPAQRLLDAPRK